MNYFDDPANVASYIKMCEGYDGAEIIAKLQEYLSPGASLLELGMGPGTDLDMLKKTYKATGSDLSQTFLDIYRKNNPDADLVLLDAVELKTERTFDCIFSNKVLHHAAKEDCALSLKNQLRLLNKRGLVCHTFWHGDKIEEHHGLYFKYYLMDELEGMIPDAFEILTKDLYQEMEPDDSILMILRKLV